MAKWNRAGLRINSAEASTARHGPSVMELLNDVDWQRAAARPIGGAHTIWEIVLHIAAWADAARRRVSGEVVELTPEQNWPPVGEPNEKVWRIAIHKLTFSQTALLKLAATVTDEQLDATVPGTAYSVYFLLHGVIQHNLYHAGQIAVLKKT